MNQTLDILKALADGNRLRILAALLQTEELCACQLIDLLGISGATTSRHLAQLAAAGLIEGRKQGRWSYFRRGALLREASPLADWLRARLTESAELAADRASLTAILCCRPEEISSRQRQVRCC
ncbi:MAG: metalloregulator ArsR/SmtB family transcription factor [Candidatus Delongbacteria bacterium]